MGNGIVVTLDGVFTNGGIDLPSLMPKREFLYVDARASTYTDSNGNLRVKNKGSADDGIVEPSVTVENGEVLASAKYRGVLFKGAPAPTDRWDYSIAGYTKNFQRGGFGGLITVIDGGNGKLTNADSGGRTLRSHNSPLVDDQLGENPDGLIYSDNAGTNIGDEYPTVLARSNTTEPRLGLPTKYGEEFAVVGSYGAFGDGFHGFRIFVMYPDGRTLRNQRSYSGTTRDLNYEEIRMGVSEYDGNMPVSGFAAWNSALEWDEMELACRVLLGLETY